MTEPIAWTVTNDATGLPDSAAPSTVLVYALRNGQARAAPVVVDEPGVPGMKKLTPSDDDRALGVVLVVDNGVGFSPRYLSGSVHDESNPFFAWHHESDTGALWTGGGTPSLLPANPALPIALVPGYPDWLWSLTPAPGQVPAAVFQITPPAGALVGPLTGSFEGYGGQVYTPGSGTTTRAILEAARAKLKTVATSRNPADLFIEHTTGLPFDKAPVSKRDGFEIVARDFVIDSGFGRAGESEKTFDMVVRLGHAPFSSDDTRESLVARDVHRIAEILEGHSWPLGLQAIFFERHTIDRTVANWWITEAHFRVVFTGAIELS